ncbi:hypothetical protein ABIE85_006140 [Bradyrhizobium diazoefficiens]
MITTLATRIALALALLARRAVRTMNCNSLVPHATRAYPVPQRVAGVRRHQGRAFDAGGH